MSSEPVAVTVRILDKEYRVACEPQEQEALEESARILDSRMRDIRQMGRVVGTDRIAVMAALNIAHELIQLQQGNTNLGGDVNERLGILQDRVAGALATQHQLDAGEESV